MVKAELTRKVALLWSKFLKTPCLTGALLSETTGLAVSSFTDVHSNDVKKYIRYYQGTSPVGIQTPLRAFKKLSVSPSGNKYCFIETCGEGEKAEDFIKIFSHDRLVVSKSFSGLHSKIHTGDPFGGFSWSSDENFLAYIAEPVEPKSKSFFELLKTAAKEEETQKNQDQSATNSKPQEKGPEENPEKTQENVSDENPETLYGTKSLHKRNWGEGLLQMKNPSLFLLDIESKQSRKIGGIPDGASVGEPCFLGAAGEQDHYNEKIAVLGYDGSARKLGLYAYNTRPSKVFLLDTKRAPETPPTAARIESRFTAITNLRASHSRRYLAYFAAEASDLHIATMRLCVYDLVSEREAVILPVQPQPKRRTDFPGIYCYSQCSAVWGKDDSFILLNTFFRSRSVLLRVAFSEEIFSECLENENNQNYDVIYPFDSAGGKARESTSVSLLDLRGNCALCKVSDPSAPSTLWRYEFPEKAQRFESKTGVSRERIKIDRFNHSSFAELEAKIIQFQPTLNKNVECGLEAILFKPKNCKSRVPLIVSLHGGPHGVSISRYNQTYHFLCSLGFAVLNVNYRGSQGFGKDFLRASLGSKNELQDVLDAIKAVEGLQEHEEVDTANIGVMGGSHGGFLTLKLISLFPEKFKAAAALNPVTNIPALLATTDIPDWSFVESGLKIPKDGSFMPTASDLEKMLGHSPSFGVKDVKAPTILLLGGRDVRVPCSHSQSFVDALRAKGVECRVHYYKEGTHPLNQSPEMETDVVLNLAFWFIEHLKDGFLDLKG